jgi:hypothetical protein
VIPCGTTQSYFHLYTFLCFKQCIITTYNWIQHYSTHQSYKVTCLCIHYLLLMWTIWPFILIHDIMSKLSPWVTTWESKKKKVEMKVKLRAWSQFIMHTTWNFQTNKNLKMLMKDLKKLRTSIKASTFL